MKFPPFFQSNFQNGRNPEVFGTTLKDFIATLSIATPIVFVDNPVYQTTNNIYSLYLAKNVLLEDDTLLFESDLIVDDAVVQKIYNHPLPNLALVAKYESWMDGTVVTIDKDCNILNFIPLSQFRFEEIPSYYKTVNIYRFSREFSESLYIPFLEAYCNALGKNEYYEQVLRVISTLGVPGIKALPLDHEAWYEIDDIQDLNIAESIFATNAQKLSKTTSRYGGFWRYPNMLDFCYLVNPCYPGKRLIDELKANFERLLTSYPSGLAVNNLLIGKDYHLPSDYVCIGNGASELIRSLTSVQEGTFGLLTPTFEEYANRLPSERKVYYTPDNADYSYTADDLIRFFSDKNIQNLILVNPDNPSGNLISRNAMLRLCDWTRPRGIRLVVDESFLDFAENREEETLLSRRWLETYPHLCVVKSISKSYGVPGLRLGFLASANIELLNKIRQDVSIWNINSFAEFYLQICGKYESDYRNACEKFQTIRLEFYQKLREIPWLRVIPSQANYFLCEVTDRFTSTRLAEFLLCRYNILIKDCRNKFNGKNYVRIAVRDSVDNEKILHALWEIHGDEEIHC